MHRESLLFWHCIGEFPSSKLVQSLSFFHFTASQIHLHLQTAHLLSAACRGRLAILAAREVHFQKLGDKTSMNLFSKWQQERPVTNMNCLGWVYSGNTLGDHLPIRSVTVDWIANIFMLKEMGYVFWVTALKSKAGNKWIYTGLNTEKAFKRKGL